MLRHHHHKTDVAGAVEFGRLCIAQQAEVCDDPIEPVFTRIPRGAGAQNFDAIPHLLLEEPNAGGGQFKAVARMARTAVEKQSFWAGRYPLRRTMENRWVDLRRKVNRIAVIVLLVEGPQRARVGDAVIAKPIRQLRLRGGGSGWIKQRLEVLEKIKLESGGAHVEQHVGGCPERGHRGIGRRNGDDRLGAVEGPYVGC